MALPWTPSRLITFWQRTAASGGMRHLSTGTKQRLVFTWGSGWNGRTGHNSRSVVRAPKQLSYLDSFNVVKVHTKGKHMLALTDDGRVFAWGSNEGGQLGLGESQKALLGQYYDYHMPMVVEGLPKIVDIAAGYSTSAAIDDQGKLWVWGSNAKGQLSRACTASCSAVPRQVPGFGDDQGLRAVKVSLGAEHTAVIDDKGMLWTWGSDDYGRLGHGTRYSMKLGSKVLEPTMVAYFSAAEPSGQEASGGLGAGLRVRHVSCGQAHTLVTTETDQVFAFGKNNRQQLGCDTGAYVNRAQQFDCADVPTPVPVIADRVQCSNTYSAALDKEGKPLFWGGPNASPTPIKRAGGKAFRTKFVDISVGINHIALVNERGRLFMMGKNTFGELGIQEKWYRVQNPLAAMRTEPVAVAELKDYHVLQVTCGNRCTAALVERREAGADDEEETAAAPPAEPKAEKGK
eukprot:RCo046599